MLYRSCCERNVTRSSLLCWFTGHYRLSFRVKKTVDACLHCLMKPNSMPEASIATKISSGDWTPTPSFVFFFAEWRHLFLLYSIFKIHVFKNLVVIRFNSNLGNREENENFILVVFLRISNIVTPFQVFPTLAITKLPAPICAWRLQRSGPLLL